MTELKAISGGRTPRSEQRCGNCDSWREHPEHGAGNGLCQHNPPVPIMVGMAQRAPNVLLAKKQPMQAEPVIGSYFPPMQARSWCKRWERKVEE